MTTKAEKLRAKRNTRAGKAPMTNAEKQQIYRARSKNKPKGPVMTPEVEAYRNRLSAGIKASIDIYDPLDRLLGLGLIGLTEHTEGREFSDVCRRLFGTPEARAADPRRIPGGGKGRDPEKATDLARYDAVMDAVRSRCGRRGWDELMNALYYRRMPLVAVSDRRRAVTRLTEALEVLAQHSGTRRGRAA